MNQFFAKAEKPLTFSSPLSRLGNTISIPKSTALVDGYLAAADFATFAAKENVLSFSSPLARVLNAISLSYNATNLKITSNALNTIQDIATSSRPLFAGLDIGVVSATAKLYIENNDLSIYGISIVDRGNYGSISASSYLSTGAGSPMATINGYAIPTGQTPTAYNLGDTISGLNFGTFGLFSGCYNQNVGLNGILTFGGGGWFMNQTVKFVNGLRAFAITDTSVNGGVVAKDNIAGVYVKTISSSVIPTLSPNEFGYYSEIPLQGTQNFQYYGQGIGIGTGYFMGGTEYRNTEIITDLKNRDLSATPDWTGTNWTYDAVNDKITHTTGSTANLTLANAKLNSGSIINGRKYFVCFRISGRTAGTVTAKLGTASGTAKQQNVLHYVLVTANANNSDLIFTPTSDFNGSIYDISLIDTSLFNYARVYSSALSSLDFAIDINGVETRRLQFNSTGIGFFNSTPAAKQTLNVYATNSQASAYSGIDNAQAGSVYAQVADLNLLRAAYENLRASYDDLRTKLQTTTLVG